MIHDLSERISGLLSLFGGIFTMILAFLDSHAAGIGALGTIIATLVYVYISLQKNRRENKKFKSLWKDLDG